jgi:hypothetical protein
MLRVLVVDDDGSVRRVMSQILAALGYAVVTANNGLDALHLFHSEGEGISLIITDLRMPIMDGRETVERIRQLNPSARIICMSSDSERCPEGATFLPKPFSLAAVQECVSRVLSAAASTPQI